MYDWSELDRETLFSSLFSIKDQIISSYIKINDFHHLISKHIKNEYPIRIRKFRSNEVNPNTIMMGGFYYSDLDKKHGKSIELILVYPKLNKKLNLTKHKFTRFCFNFADTILHEIIHMRQYRRRNFKGLPGYKSTAQKTEQRKQQTYLGNTDELGAYAFNIACELTDSFNGNRSKIISYLSKTNKKILKNNTWNMYLNAFDYNHNHKIIKRLKKRIMYYISRNQLNKPFLTNDWLDW